jgi:hypothetical protein
MSPSGTPATLPSASLRSNAGAIACHNPGSVASDSAIEMMMTSWIASVGSRNSRNGGAERTAKPKPVNV